MKDRSLVSLDGEAGCKTLFEHATMGVLLVNHKNCIVMANPWIEKLFGYDASELEGMQVEALLKEKFHNISRQFSEKQFEKNKLKDTDGRIRITAIKKNGREFPVEISFGYAGLNNEQLEILFINSIAGKQVDQDDLEIRVMERTRELMSSVQREKELNEMKSRFVAIASHEFRTPLSAILSSIGLIAAYHGPENQEKINKHIERVRISVKNLTDILERFLSLDKLEQGKVEIAYDDIDVIEFSREIMDEVSGILKDGQKINFSYNGDNVVKQDRKVLRIILLNVLSNAVKYSDEHKQIHWLMDISDSVFRIKVADEGIGIPEADQQYLFANFFRAKNVADIQGTGLGLNIIKKYTELLNGKITFKSETGKGTTFMIEFPKRG